MKEDKIKEDKIKEDKNKDPEIEISNNITYILKEKKEYKILKEERIKLVSLYNNLSISKLDYFCSRINEIDNKVITDYIKNKYDIFNKDENKLVFNINIIVDKVIKSINIDFTEEQRESIKELIIFYTSKTDPEKELSNFFGLYGYPGSGKTTVSVGHIFSLINSNLINNVCLCASTNQAVDVIKAKVIDYVKLLNDDQIKNRKDFGEIFDMLKEKNINIDFMTIHRLLNYEHNYNEEGEKVFSSGKKIKLKRYDLIIIDECSMISKEVINTLLKELKTYKDYEKPKILFTGDDAQLPPVKEKASEVFKLDILKYTLCSVVRTKNKDVIDFCNNIRLLVEKHKKPKLISSDNVIIYEDKEKWIKQYLKDYKKGITNNSILTWTNKSTDEYNEKIRELIFKKKIDKIQKLQRFEIGDIIMFLNYYKCVNYEDLENSEEIKEDCSIIFKTSEQVKILNTDIQEFKIKKFGRLKPDFDSLELEHNADWDSIKNKYDQIIKNMNNKFKKIYKIWILEIQTNNINLKDNKTGLIYVIHEDDLEIYKLEVNRIIQDIKNLSKSRYFPKDIIEYFWKDFYNVYIDCFAKVSIAYSMTTHRSQGSTFSNVYVDVEDILKNINSYEGKRCLYTAITRTANKIHFLF